MEDNVPPFGLSVNEWSFYQYVLASPKGTKFTDRPESMDVQDAYIAMNSLLKKVLSFFLKKPPNIREKNIYTNMPFHQNALEIIIVNNENVLKAIDLTDAEK